MGQAVGALKWHVVRSVNLPMKHVNVHEVGEAIQQLSEHAAVSLCPEEHNNGTDSRVGIGAIAHGRSSSVDLNIPLRKLTTTSVFLDNVIAVLGMQRGQHL